MPGSSVGSLPQHLHALPKATVAGCFVLAGSLLLAACQWLIFVFAPVEATLGLPQKIFYLHVPLAWWGMLSFFITCLSSILFLLTRKKKWDLLALATAEMGLLLAGLALIAGSFWAKASWGVWWLWDPRLTTTLIMCLTYAGYLIFRHLEMPEHKRDQIAAVIGIIAFLDVPLVYISSRLWSFIHPPSVQLDQDMRLVMWACIGALSLVWLGMTMLRYQLALAEHRAHVLVMRQRSQNILQ